MLTHNNKINIIHLFFLVSLVLFSSCTAINHSYKRPEGITDGIYRDIISTDSVSLASVPWKTMFTDPKLQVLIEEALSNNFDLQIAAARIKQAEANFRQSKAALFPTLDVNGSAAYNSSGGFDDYSEAYNLSAGSSWELDIWGKLRSTKRAYLNALLESEAYKRSVQTQLIADIASYYYTLLSYDAQLGVYERTLDSYIEDVNSIKILMENSSATGADLAQSEANRYSAEVSIPEIKRNIKETENSICLLLGRKPGSIDRSDLSSQNITTKLKVGVPVQLLANRPDVQKAEYALRYYAEMSNVARAYFYPTLSITADAGLSSTSMNNLFDASSVFSNIVGGIASPVFNQRANRKRLAIAKAQEEEYLASFKEAVIQAGIEVSNALYSYQIATEKTELRQQQISSLEKAVDYTRKLLEYSSSTNYTDVLTSEQHLLNAQLSNINDKIEQLVAVIDLYRSLGGGSF